MRFLSRFGGFGVQIRPMIEEGFATGIAKTTQIPVYAMFHVFGLTPEERDLAHSHWRGNFNGFYQAEDEVTIIPPDYRIGVFDSEEAQMENGWSDDMRFEVERTLVDHAERFNDVIAVPVVRIPPPWPRYDEYTGSAKALVRKLIDEGYDLNNVLAYEQENLNRAAIVAELESLLGNATELAELQEEVLG